MIALGTDIVKQDNMCDKIRFAIIAIDVPNLLLR